MSPAASACGWGQRRRRVFLSFFQQGQAYIFCRSCLKGWLQALGVGSRSLMVFQWVFVRSDCAPPGGLRSSPRVIYYLSPPPAALRLRGRCQRRCRGGGRDRGVPVPRWRDGMDTLLPEDSQKLFQVTVCTWWTSATCELISVKQLAATFVVRRWRVFNMDGRQRMIFHSH